MSINSQLRSGAALSLALCAGPALADLTPAQVWGDWQSYLEGFGYGVTADTSESGGTLTISNMAMTMSMPDDEGDFTFNVSEMTMTDNGDGTVSIGFPAAMPITFDVAPEVGEAVSGEVTLTQTGLTMVASGDPDNVTYTYSAASMGMTMGSMVVEGQPMDAFDMTVDMQNVTGASTNETGTMRSMDQSFAAGALTYNINAQEPGSSNTFAMQGGLQNLAFTGGGAMPLVLDPEAMGDALNDGFAFGGSYSYENGNLQVNVTESGQPFQGSTSSDGGDFEISMDADGLVYNVASKGLSVEAAGAELPLPISFQMAEAGFRFGMPVMKKDEEQDFAFGLTFRDFVMADMLWSIFDPTQVLSRDPATIDLDLTGKTKLLVDFFDPEQMAMLESTGGVPGELNALTLASLLVRVAGAELTGSGAFTFDNNNLAQFDGFPAPQGALDLRLVGGNGLLDNLVQMGILPEDDAMGARMMMGLFAIPGAGEDELTSRIEINDEGHVLANGQRIQ